MPYSKSDPTFRTAGRNAAAARARLGCETFVDFFVPRAMPNGLVREHCPEGRPARIENGFRHAGFGESSSAHITRCNVIEVSHDAMRELVKEITSSPRNASTDLSDLSPLSCALRPSQGRLKLPEVTRILDLFASRQRGEILQAEIDSHSSFWASGLRVGNFDDDIQEPVPASITGKVCAVFDLAIGKWAAVEHAKRAPSETEGIAFAFQIATFERDPTKRLPAAIAKVRSSMLLAGLGVLLACRIDRPGMNAEFFAAASCQDVQIKARRPLLTPFQGVLLRVIAKIPDVADRTALLIQQAGKRFHAVAIDNEHATHCSGIAA